MAKPNSNTGKALKPNIETIKAALRDLKSPKKKKAEERQAAFAKLYPDIRDQLNDEVSVRKILNTIAPLLPLTYEIFNELLKNEAAHRDEPVPGQASDKEIS